MKRDIILSCLVAVAVHLFVLSIPLPEGCNTDRYMHNSISVSMIPPKTTAVPQSTLGSPHETGLKPDVALKSRVVPQETLISKKPQSLEKKLTAKPAIKKKEFQANITENLARHRPASFAPESPMPNLGESVGNLSIGREPKIPDEANGKGSFLEATSTTNDTSQGERKIAGTPERSESGEGIVTYAMPRYKENPSPNYPRVARTRGYEGRTLLRVEVFETGKVGRIEITTSSGFEVLDKAALESVKGWTFVPGTKNGAKTTQWVMVPIRFCLN
jgi:protein TonB